MNEETYYVIKDYQSIDEMAIVNFAIGKQKVLFTGSFEECDQFRKYPIQDDIWPSRRWNQDHTDYIDLSGNVLDFDLDVFDYEAFQDECAQGQDLLDQQSISDAYEEMQELDPRDYDRVDDFGDPTT